ncbi:MAG: glycerate kinase [Rhodospirillaceae bacterium]
MASVEARQLLLKLFAGALAAVEVDHRLPPHLPTVPRGRTVVVGAGKAAAAMAYVVEMHWPGPLSGLVVTRYDHVRPKLSAAPPTAQIEIIEASHPLPDDAGEQAARRILELASGLGADDLLLCLISGGGSALLTVPAPGLTLADKRAVTSSLLACGATISETNCVRKHLSAIKGGRLAAAAAPARVVSLLLSDVPGDVPSVIASGPTLADPTTRQDALSVLAKYHVAPPLSVAMHLMRPESETPKPGDIALANTQATVIAAAQDGLEAAASIASAAGLTPFILSDAFEGEAREVARFHADIVRQILRYGQPFNPPCVIISGGETAVTVRGNGLGGRNTEFALALSLALEGAEGVYAISCDTDGIDGRVGAAGALVFPDTLTRAAARGLDARTHLNNNDSATFFTGLDDLVITGPTLTNVNDFRAILIDPAGRVVSTGKAKP